MTMDDEHAARMATEHLVELGHRRIGFISGSDEYSLSQWRVDGWRAAMKAAGLGTAGLLAKGDFTFASGEAAARAFARACRAADGDHRQQRQDVARNARSSARSRPQRARRFVADQLRRHADRALCGSAADVGRPADRGHCLARRRADHRHAARQRASRSSRSSSPRRSIGRQSTAAGRRSHMSAEARRPCSRHRRAFCGFTRSPGRAARLPMFPS